jgi:hypothetical protein
MVAEALARPAFAGLIGGSLAGTEIAEPRIPGKAHLMHEANDSGPPYATQA